MSYLSPDQNKIKIPGKGAVLTIIKNDLSRCTQELATISKSEFSQ